MSGKGGSSGGGVDGSDDDSKAEAGGSADDATSDIDYAAACTATAVEHAKLHPDAVCIDECLCGNCPADAVVCYGSAGCSGFVNCANAMGCLDAACAIAKCPDQFAEAGSEGVAQATALAACIARANCAMRCMSDAFPPAD
jgi:hypothetical protein